MVYPSGKTANGGAASRPGREAEQFRRICAPGRLTLLTTATDERGEGAADVYGHPTAWPWRDGWDLAEDPATTVLVSVSRPARMEEVRGARQLTRAVLAALPRVDADDAELLVGELVANAVTHGGPGRFSLRIGQVADDHVVVVVTNKGGGGRPQLVNPDIDAEAGRGLQIVDNVSTKWGVVMHDEGEVSVWFELREPTRNRLAPCLAASVHEGGRGGE